jgi:hypothetical protein
MNWAKIYHQEGDNAIPSINGNGTRKLSLSEDLIIQI